MTSTNDKGSFIGIRHLQALLLFLDIVVLCVSRLNINVAVVAMTNAETTNPHFPEFDWNEREKSYIISSFYVGYVLMQFPGGYLSRRFGVRLTLFVATFGCAICSLITPISVASGRWQIFCVIRFIQGLLQGVMFPAVHTHLAMWSPVNERNRLGAFAHTGSNCGAVIATLTTGIIAAGPMGWPGIFYISSGMCFIWSALWLIFAANNASASAFISKAEIEYIDSLLQHADNFHTRKAPIPWLAICKSIPFIALLTVRCFETYGVSILSTQIPTFLHGVLNLEIISNSLYSALPFLANWIFSYIYLIIGDFLIRKKALSLTALRKTFNTLALWIPAISLICIGFLEDDQMIFIITLLTIAFALNAGSIIGSILNTMDLSPNHAGILMGIINCASNISPIIGTLMVGIIVTDEQNRSLWQIVFATAAVAFFLGNMVYIIWGSTNIQPWDAVDFMLTTVKTNENRKSLEQSKKNKNCVE